MTFRGRLRRGCAVKSIFSKTAQAIAATVIGGASLAGGVGWILGTVIGTLILGVVTAGFTFLRVDAYYQEMEKGAIIVAAVTVDVYRNKRKRKE